VAIEGVDMPRSTALTNGWLRPNLVAKSRIGIPLARLASSIVVPVDW
jgi:hypothetical protein